MKVLFLARYSYDGASSRYRTHQFIPYFEKAGIYCVIQPFFHFGYLNMRFSNKKSLLIKIIKDYFNRFKVLRSGSDFDVIFVEKEFFPYIPWYFELLNLPEKTPYVCDYDDAMFHAYGKHSSHLVRWILNNKIEKVMSSAASIITGSKYIYNYALKHNNSVHHIPTSINIEKYPRTQINKSENTPFMIGWIGSHSTLLYLKMIENLLNRFCDTHNAKVLVIGDNMGVLNIKSIMKFKWTDADEVKFLSMIDVGIMPLPDTAWSKGKCAFKLIQYMGCWKPVIASRIGENTIVVDEGVNGFLVDTPEGWWRALESLYENRDLGETMGVAGRAKVEQEYSSSVIAPRLMKILKDAASLK